MRLAASPMISRWCSTHVCTTSSRSKTSWPRSAYRSMWPIRSSICCTRKRSLLTAEPRRGGFARGRAREVRQRSPDRRIGRPIPGARSAMLQDRTSCDRRPSRRGGPHHSRRDPLPWRRSRTPGCHARRAPPPEPQSGPVLDAVVDGPSGTGLHGQRWTSMILPSESKGCDGPAATSGRARRYSSPYPCPEQDDFSPSLAAAILRP